MSHEQQRLYQRILDYEMNDLSHVIGFNDHLMRNNGWSHDFALRAIAEYRKFIFLAMVADHQVTPSDQVDQVWHLHLLFSDAYWNDFCPRVLGRPLHHEPTRGGAAERQRFHHLYRATLTSYRQNFGDPPLDLWPPVEVRFGPDLQMQRRRIRPPFRPWHHLRSWWSVPGWALLLVPLSAAVVWADDSAEAGSINLDAFVHVFGLPTVLAFTFWSLSRVLWPLLRQPARGADPCSLTNGELAYLAGGPVRVLQLTLAELVLKGVVVPDVRGRSLVLLRDRLCPLQGLPQQMVSVHQRLRASLSSSAVKYDELVRPSRFSESLAPLLSTLQGQQLILRGWARLLPQTAEAWRPLLIVVWAVSTVVELSAPSSRAALAPSTALWAICAGVSLALAGSTGRTIWGDKVLEQHQADRAHADPLRTVALVGPPAMTGGRLDDLRELIEGVAADMASSCAGC